MESWNVDPPPSFQGLDPNKQLTICRRHLPHLRQAGATYFVTFRQGDSLPSAKRDELRQWRKSWERDNPKPHSTKQLNELWRATFTKVEHWLDQGMGSCLLRAASVRQLVVDSLHHFADERYELACYVVMPNHVHLLVCPFSEDDKALSRIMQSWKRHSSYKIKCQLGLHDDVWQQESYDRIIRDEDHLWRVVQYIGRNPLSAHLSPSEYTRWMNPLWESLGWTFLNE